MTDIKKMIQMERDPEVLKAKVNLETAQIAWKELQKYFASGMAICVDSDLDMTEVALQISQDNKAQIEQWMHDGKVDQVSDKQALAWFEADAILWACVIRPWVLVQERKDG